MEILGPEDAGLMLRYQEKNRAHLSPWEPLREAAFFTPTHWQNQLQENRDLFNMGTAFRFSALAQDRSEIIGLCNFTNVIHGVFQACNLGYSVAEKYQGQGLMQEILEAGIAYMFEVVGMHRIMANHLPRNHRSEKLLSRLGFEREGLARSYLMIAGRWEDHILNSKINPRDDLSKG